MTNQPRRKRTTCTVALVVTVVAAVLGISVWNMYRFNVVNYAKTIMTSTTFTTATTAKVARSSMTNPSSNLNAMSTPKTASGSTTAGGSTVVNHGDGGGWKSRDSNNDDSNNSIAGGSPDGVSSRQDDGGSINNSIGDDDDGRDTTYTDRQQQQQQQEEDRLPNSNHVVTATVEANEDDKDDTMTTTTMMIQRWEDTFDYRNLLDLQEPSKNNDEGGNTNNKTNAPCAYFKCFFPAKETVKTNEATALSNSESSTTTATVTTSSQFQKCGYIIAQERNIHKDKDKFDAMLKGYELGTHLQTSYKNVHTIVLQGSPPKIIPTSICDEACASNLTYHSYQQQLLKNTVHGDDKSTSTSTNGITTTTTTTPNENHNRDNDVLPKKVFTHTRPIYIQRVKYIQHYPHSLLVGCHYIKLQSTWEHMDGFINHNFVHTRTQTQKQNQPQRDPLPITPLSLSFLQQFQDQMCNVTIPLLHDEPQLVRDFQILLEGSSGLVYHFDLDRVYEVKNPIKNKSKYLKSNNFLQCIANLRNITEYITSKVTEVQSLFSQ